MCILAIIIDHPTYIASQHRGRTKPLYDGNVKILNDGFFTNIKSRAYTVTKTDIDVWESKNGRIPNGALVILRTGWSQYFHQPDNFFGNFAKLGVWQTRVFSLGRTYAEARQRLFASLHVAPPIPP